MIRTQFTICILKIGGMMEYLGRIILLSLAIVLSLTYYLLDREFNAVRLFFDVIVAIVSWYLGYLFDRLRFLAFNDHLTKVYNRRYGDRHIPKLLQKAELKKENLVIFILDVNNFKGLNDTFGHQAGDIALKKLSSVLLKNIRKSDLVIRWGGDEFLIVVQNTDKCMVENLIDRVTTSFKTEMEGYNQNDIDLGISFGYAAFPNDSKNYRELLTIADKKMYKAKVSNR